MLGRCRGASQQQVASASHLWRLTEEQDRLTAAGNRITGELAGTMTFPISRTNQLYGKGGATTQSSFRPNSDFDPILLNFAQALVSFLEYLPNWPVNHQPEYVRRFVEVN